MRIALNIFAALFAFIGALGAFGLCLAPILSHGAGGFDRAVTLFGCSVLILMICIPAATLFSIEADRR